jgi:hypothetical protein
MKYQMILLFVALFIFSLTNAQEEYELNWKIGKKEKLIYFTSMQQIDPIELEMDIDEVFGIFFNDSASSKSKTEEMLKEFQDLSSEMNMKTTLTNSGEGYMDIVMEMTPNKENTEDDDEMSIMKKMMQGVVLRGSVNNTGSIHSFWVRNDQRNLISLLFELPENPVKTGDSWELDIHLISNDHNFICSEATRKNNVTLVKVEEIDSEKIAILKYDISEYVKGDFTKPAFMGSSGGPVETTVKSTHSAIAKFSIDKGRWISYDGIMSVESTGFMKSSGKTKFSLKTE